MTVSLHGGTVFILRPVMLQAINMTGDHIKHDYLIDARGHRCPVPTLKLRKMMATLPGGAQAVLWADDPMAQIDLPHFCSKNNYIIESSHKLDNFWVFIVSAKSPE